MQAIIANGTPEEVAALVVAIQERREQEDDFNLEQAMRDTLLKGVERAEIQLKSAVELDLEIP